MAIYGMGVVLAPAAGPVLGGWLIDNYGWPWIFYINVPICILGILLVGAFVMIRRTCGGASSGSTGSASPC